MILAETLHKMNPTDNLTICLIPKDQLSSILPLIKTLNPSVGDEVLFRRLQQMIGQDYQCVGAYLNEQLVGVCGFWVTTRFYCGKQIELDNVVIHPHYRSTGIGQKLMAWVYDYGLSIGCEVCELNSYASNSRSHKFYFNEGFSILGYHFQKPLR